MFTMTKVRDINFNKNLYDQIDSNHGWAIKKINKSDK